MNDNEARFETDAFAKAVRQAVQIETFHLEMMAAAYLQKTKIDPREVELVRELRDEGDRKLIVWYYRPRQGNAGAPGDPWPSPSQSSDIPAGDDNTIHGGKNV